uniref:Uncharacterized protein n=1 Tax=viral metagenome TaxID=1070528 RepID=A0A6C0I4B5_9ZZZZ
MLNSNAIMHANPQLCHAIVSSFVVRWSSYMHVTAAMTAIDTITTIRFLQMI